MVVDARPDPEGRAVVTLPTSGRRRRAALGALPDLLELIVIAVRAGASPAAAVVATRDLAPAVLVPVVDDVVLRLQRGQRFADALAAFGEHHGPVAAAFVDALVAADRYGAPLGPVLDRVITDVRDERRRRAERDARTLPVRLAFPLVACTLPAFVLVAIVPALLGAVSTLRAAP
jgi:tight adherence protein C